MRKKDSKIASKVIAIVILLAFVGSMFAITQFGDASSNEASIKISGYTFYEESGSYVTETEYDGLKYKVGFISNPEDVKNISLNHYALTLLDAQNKVYLTHNPNKISREYSTAAYSEIGKFLVNLKGKEVTFAFTEDQDPPDLSVPLYSCEDASASTGIIELRLGDETKIDVEGSCVIVQGEDEFAMLEASSKLSMWLAGLEI